MRIILSLFISLFAFSFAAQSKTPPTKKDAPKEATKTAPSESQEKTPETIDLDAFFKKGEENAKKGSSCDKPADPIA